MTGAGVESQTAEDAGLRLLKEVHARLVRAGGVLVAGAASSVLVAIAGGGPATLLALCATCVWVAVLLTSTAILSRRLDRLAGKKTSIRHALLLVLGIGFWLLAALPLVLLGFLP